MENKNIRVSFIAAFFIFMSSLAGSPFSFAGPEDSGDQRTLALINNYEDKIKELVEEISLFKGRLIKLTQSNEQLESELKVLKLSQQDNRAQVDILDTTNTQLIQVKINLEKQIQDLNRLLSSLTVEKDYKIKQLQDEVNQHRELEQELKSEVQESIKQNNWLKDQYVKDHKINDELKVQAASLANQKETLANSLKDAEKTINGLKAENEVLFKQNLENSQLVKDYTAKAKEKEQAEKQNQAVRQAFLQFKDNYQQTEKLYKQLQDEHRAQGGQLKEAKLKQEGLETALLQLKMEKERLQQQYKQFQDTNKLSIQELSDLKAKAQNLESLSRQFEKLQADYDALQGDLKKLKNDNEKMSKDKESLNMKLAQENVSSRLSAVVKRNEELVKENAILHYNLGVCYTQSQNFDRAVLEFEKVLKLNPNDSETQYNLGVIYAEHAKDQAKAIEHFRKYLLLSPQDQDADRARRYIMTHEILGEKN